MGTTVEEETKEERNKRLKDYKIQLKGRLIARASELREETPIWKHENGLSTVYDHSLTKAKNFHDKVYPINNQLVEELSDAFLLAFNNNDRSFFLPYEEEEIYKIISRLRHAIPFSPNRKKANDYKRVITSSISKFKVSRDERLLSPGLLKFLGISLDDILYNYKEIKSLQSTVAFLLQQQWFKNIIIEHSTEGIPISKNETIRKRRMHLKQLKTYKDELKNGKLRLFTIHHTEGKISKIKSSLDKKRPKFYYEISSVHFNYFCNVCWKLKQKDFNPSFIKNKTQLKLIIQKYVFLYNNIFEQEKKEYREERNRLNNRNNKPKSIEKYKKYLTIQELKAAGKNKIEIHRLEGYARSTIDKYWETNKDMEEIIKQGSNV